MKNSEYWQERFRQLEISIHTPPKRGDRKIAQKYSSLFSNLNISYNIKKKIIGTLFNFG